MWTARVLALVLGLLGWTAAYTALEVSEVNECQDLDDCPKYFNNTMADFDGNDTAAGLTVDAELAAWMNDTTTTYLAMVQRTYPPDSQLTDNSPEVFNGIGGRALMYLRRFLGFGDQTDLLVAQEYIDVALARVSQVGRLPTPAGLSTPLLRGLGAEPVWAFQISNKYSGFLWGKTGVYAVAAVIYSKLGDNTTSQAMVDEVAAIFATAPDDDANLASYDDWDSGRGGLLFAARFLQHHLANDDEETYVIPRSAVVAVAQAVVDRGARLSSSASYLEWISPNDGGKWLGMSHGSVGVLHGLLDVPEIYLDNATAKALILGTLDHIVASQQPSGNFPTEYYSEDQDELVQWDHGAPGVMAVLADAALKYLDAARTDGSLKTKVQSYVDSAVKAADCTWSRGLLTKGLMVCHGISGNTYMQLRLAALLRKLVVADADTFGSIDYRKYQWRALQFQRYVMQTPDLWEPDLMRKPTPNPYYFYTSSYESAATLWADLFAHQQDPLSVFGQPAY